MATTGMVPPGGPGGGGDDDDDGPPPPKRSRANKPCRCGATNHQRVSSKLCPLNPANGEGQQHPQGQQQEVQLPALENDDSDSDSDSDSDQEEEEEWTRYDGSDDDTSCKMNACVDTWSEWTPTNPAERALKNAVDKNSCFGRE